MTQEDFLIIANNNRTQVNVWYTETVPYTVLGVTVPTINNAGESIIGYLQQITQMTLEVSEGSFVILDITERSLLGDTPTQYYYFKTSAGIIQDPGDNLVSPGRVIFTPGINGQGFQQGGYNALLGEAQEDRRSDYIMQADRISYINTGAGLPTNIEQLETNSATRAQVQDSLYSSTGWISARYEGTKLDTLSNSGADPALQGTFFEGAVFSINAEDTTIQQLASVGAITYEEYFFTGTSYGGIPKYVLTYTGLRGDVNFPSTQDRVMKLSTFFAPINTAVWPKVGDILTFSQEQGAQGEFYKMVESGTSYSPYSFRNDNADSLWLFVERGYNNSQRENNIGDTDPSLYKISPTKIFKLANNLVQPVREGKLIVKGTDDVLYIDVNGFIIGVVGGTAGQGVVVLGE